MDRKASSSSGHVCAGYDQLGPTHLFLSLCARILTSCVAYILAHVVIAGTFSGSTNAAECTPCTVNVNFRRDAGGTSCDGVLTTCAVGEYASPAATRSSDRACEQCAGGWPASPRLLLASCPRLALTRSRISLISLYRCEPGTCSCCIVRPDPAS